jgi:phosphopantetheine adenylyltransferase
MVSDQYVRNKYYFCVRDIGARVVKVPNSINNKTAYVEKNIRLINDRLEIHYFYYNEIVLVYMFIIILRFSQCIFISVCVNLFRSN